MGLKYKSDEWYESEPVNVTMSGAYIGLATVDIGDQKNVSLKGNVTLSYPKGYIGLVSVAQPLNTTLSGNVTISDSKGYIGLVSVAQPLNTAVLGNVTISDSKGYIGLVSCATVNATTNMVTLISGEDQTNNVMMVEGQFSYGGLIAASTVAIKGAAGLLHTINIGAISCPSIIVYDSTVPSGTIIHRFNAGAPIGTYTFDVKFPTGLSLDAILGGGGVAPVVTVSFR